MLDQILKVIEPTIISILGIIISGLGVIVVSYVKSKRDEVITKIGQDEYNHNIKIAKDVWNFAEEEFRFKKLIGEKVNDKISLFNNELLKRIPYLTQEQINGLRQTIAGEVNKGKEAIMPEVNEEKTLTKDETVTPAPQEGSTESLMQQLQMENQKLQAEKEQLVQENTTFKQAITNLNVTTGVTQ